VKEALNSKQNQSFCPWSNTSCFPAGKPATLDPTVTTVQQYDLRLINYFIHDLTLLLQASSSKHVEFVDRLIGLEQLSYTWIVRRMVPVSIFHRYIYSMIIHRHSVSHHQISERSERRKRERRSGRHTYTSKQQRQATIDAARDPPSSTRSHVKDSRKGKSLIVVASYIA
jgi:hypothetical protein